MSKIIQSAYSAIESQKYKKAASLLESPDVARFPLAKSLKGYCYARLGNPTKVKESIEELIKLKPTDMTVIHQAMDCIHYVNDYSLAVRLLEEAHKNDKHNIETGELLYDAYFWTRNFDKMRDLSLDLIKLYKMKKYSLWNTVNILFNTNPEDPEKFKKVMLLSEMMVKNQLKSMDITSREGRSYQWLLMEILIREQKYEEAETILEDRMSNYIVSQRLLDERLIQRTVLRELHREKEILSLLEQDILSGQKSDWDCIEYYINTVFELCTDDEKSKHLIDFENQYCKECTTREQWLYRMEVASRMKDFSKLTQLITQYVNFIGHKQCCYVDVERWLPFLQDQTKCIEELTQYIISILNITFCIVKGNDLLNIVEKKINVIQIAIFLGIPINESFLKELLKTYELMIPQYKDTLATKEILSLDYIPLVLAILLHKKAIQQEVSPIEQFTYHCEALSLLEKSREERPHFFLATLASCLLYYQLGCPNEAFHCYEQLSVKEIQTMSMCYLIEPLCREWSVVKESRDMFNQINMFLYDALKQGHKKQMECISEGTFMNLFTMNDLNERLANSCEKHHFHVLYYLNSLSSSLKEPDFMNQVCFDEFATIPSKHEYIENADHHIIRFWNIEKTQMGQVFKANAYNELFAFEEAMCCFFYQFMKKDRQFEKVDKSILQLIKQTLQELKAKIHSISILSYCIVGEVLEMLDSKECEKAEKEISNYLQEMKELMKAVSHDSIYDAAILSQVNQVMNHSAVWLELLLSKNKKCSKPSPAKEPTSAVIMTALTAFFEMADLKVPEKKEYSSILEKNNVAKGHFIPSLKNVADKVCANHMNTITQITSMKTELLTQLKKKNYRMKVQGYICLF